MTRGTIVLLGGLALIAAVTGLYVAQRATKESPPDIVATAVKIGGPFELVTHTGRTVTDADFRGKYLLVFFGYTFCPDVCPTTLRDVADTLDALGPLANAVQPLFITVDPARDTPQVLAEYVTAFDPRLIGLTGTRDQIARVTQVYRVYYAKATENTGTDPNSYLMDHSAFTYLMGPDGAYVTLFPYGTGPEKMAETIRKIIAMRGSK